MGIGLTVVRKLAEMHGGSVSVASGGSGQGSEFTVRLPLSDAVEQPEVAEQQQLATGSLKILVVDDNVDMARSIATLLKSLGHKIVLAHDGPSALEHARSQGPDVILLDIGLPGMNGYEVARRVRAMPGGHVIRLVALTGYGQAEDRRRALDAGFDDHLVKPVEPERLQQVLAMAAP